MLGVAASFLIALIGTFARTGLIAGSATLLMLAARSQRKFLAVLIVAAVVLALLVITPDNWLFRMDTIVNYQDDGSAMSRIAAWKWAWHLALGNIRSSAAGLASSPLTPAASRGRPGWLVAHNIFFEVMGEHGFVGLGLFCSLIAAIYRSCTRVQKRCAGSEALAWTVDLARATQVGLVALVVGGSFVSIAFSPFLYLLAGDRNRDARLAGTRTGRANAPSLRSVSDFRVTARVPAQSAA